MRIAGIHSRHMVPVSHGRLLGIDACPAGWLVAGTTDLHGTAVFHFRLVDTSGLAGACRIARFALIDIPIGLPNAQNEPRRADLGARRLLPGHGSRVFPVPVREAVYAGSYAEANSLNRTICGKGVTRQAWNICEKIRQVDALLRGAPWCRRLLRESSPEVCFAVLAGTPLPSKKSAEGLAARLDVLRKYRPGACRAVEAARSEFPRRAAATDDILDAMVLCVSAALIVSAGVSGGAPAEPVYDDAGLPMQMLYPLPQPSEKA